MPAMGWRATKGDPTWSTWMSVILKFDQSFATDVPNLWSPYGLLSDAPGISMNGPDRLAP
jgi:hypothetical protein